MAENLAFLECGYVTGESLRGMAFTRDSRKLVVGGRHAAKVIDVELRRQLSDVTSKTSATDYFSAIAALPDPRVVVAGLTNGDIVILRLPD